jgi:F-type H+-transporting ATPase subunit b
MVLAAGVGIAPLHMVAQEASVPAKPEPAGQTAGGQAAQSAKAEAGNSEPSNSEDDQTKAFRLEGPLVKATAKALNLTVETTADIYEIINFAIIVLAIGIPLWRFVPKFIRQRGEKVRTDIESARKVTEDANSRLSAVEDKLSKIDEEIAKFRAEVEQEMGQDETRIKAALKEETARIVAAAEQEIGVVAAQARRGLRNFAADLAIEQASKQLVLSPEIDRALISEFVGDVNRGGQN